jgi:O-antigen/teichoic acid export membrane protein
MLARKSVLVISSQFFVRFLGWIAIVAITKLWGGFSREALGSIAFAMSFVGMFNVVADLGLTQAHIKRVSEGKDLGTCIGSFIAIKVLLDIIFVAIFLTSMFIWKTFLNGGFHDATTESIIYVFLLYYVISNIQQIPLSTFNGKGEMAKLQLTAMSENLVKVPLTILIALAGVAALGIAPVGNWPEFLRPLQNFIASHAIGSQAMAYVFGMTASLIVGLLIMRKYPIHKPDIALIKSYFTFALPTLLISVLLTLSTNIDRIMIGFFWTAIEVGYYYVMQQIILIILIISAAMSVVLFPAFSRLHAEMNYDGLRKTIHDSERYISIIMVPIVVVLIVFAKQIILVMSDSAYLPAVPVLISLSIFAFIYTFMSLHTSLIIGLNRPGIAAKNGLVIYSLNIILNLLFIPQWGVLTPFGINGPTGAAIATTISTFVGWTILKIEAKRLLQARIIPVQTLLHISAGIIMGLTLYGFTRIITIDHWYGVLIFSLIGLLIYLAVLYLIREFTKRDFNFFLNLLKPNEMYKYIKDEIKEESGKDDEK